MAVRAAASTAEVRSALVPLLAAPVNERGRIVVDALEVFVSDVRHPVDHEIYLDLLGAPATSDIEWTIDYKRGDPLYGEARARMAVTAAQLAVRLDAEVCLCHELDLAVMRRRAGVLELYSWFPEWSIPEVQAALTGPWRLTDDEGRL
ncbi:hypothetical protein GXB85_12890 [Cellulomonas sp. APG4]|uniref:hypothetical protein n=1 Tax=Cellulomonas sp. APG4 TaxID=1538656 RepID=UPI001379D08A|nr:hypothetical protein [Cellulomonas sp. APG4]NCT91842.1 hypothetical protein [Cellulomonas sp. APG4]